MYICMYIYLYVCLWGDHFSEKRVKLNSAHAHYTANDLKNESSACMPAHSCQPLRLAITLYMETS